MVTSFHVVSAQELTGRLTIGSEAARAKVEKALKDTTVPNMIDKKIMLLSDKSLAISVAEPVLFSTYGKENILSQKPYEIYQHKGYWIIKGTLPDTMIGDTFLFIIDARDCRIVQMTMKD